MRNINNGLMTMWFILLIMLLPFRLHATPEATLLTTKHVFSTTDFTTFGGETIAEVKVGWESYGKLNAAKDNVILITHHFSGNSHAAGKYSLEDSTPGYWDSIIGPGKAIDTRRFFVISIDTLANLGAYDPNVITTGPATINPETGKPYGLDFPVVTIRDFVNVQKQVLESLGISSLYAVIGPSMGSMQALDWASAYPNWVPRMVSVIGVGESDAWMTATLEQWSMPIRLDPNWNHGDYRRDNAPLAGLTASLMIITQQALHPEFFAGQGKSLGYSPLEEAPLHDIRKSHSIVNWLHSRAEARGKTMDANHLLYLVRACQLFMGGHQKTLKEGMAKIKAKTLFLPAQSDLLLMPHMAKEAFNTLQHAGNDTQYQELQGELGHLEGVLDIQEKAETLRAFLNGEKIAE